MEDMKTPAVRQMIASQTLDRVFNSDKVERSALISPAGLTNPFPVSDGSLELSSNGPPRLMGQPSENVVLLFPREGLIACQLIISQHKAAARPGLDESTAAAAADMWAPAVRQMSTTYTLDRVFITDKVERSAVISPAGLTNPSPVSNGPLERSSSIKTSKCLVLDADISNDRMDWFKMVKEPQLLKFDTVKPTMLDNWIDNKATSKRHQTTILTDTVIVNVKENAFADYQFNLYDSFNHWTECLYSAVEEDKRVSVACTSRNKAIDVYAHFTTVSTKGWSRRRGLVGVTRLNVH
jgi:hypothetical protein